MSTDEILPAGARVLATKDGSGHLAVGGATTAKGLAGIPRCLGLGRSSPCDSPASTGRT
ncbi:hypothetical protein [Actinophytocola sp.]|uniref:hypothetical protein n=1 Tax=Actinophytocola sp. TaxID=1872138 RepID=UPI003D6BB5D7